MGQEHRRRLVLIGFSTSGKTEVGRLIAESLELPFLDSDEVVERRTGKTIERIFIEDGEARFRELEAEALRAALSAPEAGEAVVATGGGAPLAGANRELMRRSGFVVWLDVSPKAVIERHRRPANGRMVPRPLLDGKGEDEVTAFIEARRRYYRTVAQMLVPTDDRPPPAIAAEVAAAYRRWGDAAACVVRTPTESYPVYVGWNELSRLGERMAEVGLGERAIIITDTNVLSVAVRPAGESLLTAGIETDAYTVDPGEGSKTLLAAKALYDKLAEVRVDRGTAIVALGGGVIGDLAGFVAATYLRGLPLVQAPTSLLAMVDAAIGGKVAVDLPVAKNLVGAFYQPRLVVADTARLATLPRRELVSGFAEVVKHGLILDATYFEFLEASAEVLLRLHPPLVTEAVARSMALKAAVVSEDPTERAVRLILNYGHTIGHGLEAAADYSGMLHGEAVAVGMVGAAMIGERMGVTPRSVVERQDAALRRFGLPLRAPDIAAERVLAAMQLDKKARGRSLRWVLLRDIGDAAVYDDVPDDLASEVVRTLTAR